MSLYRVVLLVLFVVGGAVTAAVPAGATADAGGDATDVVTREVSLVDVRPAAANGTNNTSLGADISSFMQSSTAEVGGAVETGMWAASFNATDNESVRVTLVEQRTAELRSQLEALQQRKEELVSEREAGNVSETVYTAKISRLLGQINALQSAINATTVRAKSVNAEVESLSTLRSEAQNLTGPEIASVARNVTGVGNGQRGPPSDVGNGNGVAGSDDGATGPPNGTANGTANASNPGVGGDSGNESASDPPKAGKPAEPPVTGNNSTTAVPAATSPTGFFDGFSNVIGVQTALFRPALTSA